MQLQLQCPDGVGLLGVISTTGGPHKFFVGYWNDIAEIHPSGVSIDSVADASHDRIIRY